MMRWILGQVVIALASVAIAAPAAATPTVIARLGAAPLLGNSASTRELRIAVKGHPQRVSAAAWALGLSPAEYRAFLSTLSAHTLPWGVLPRHVGAMAFYRAGSVHVLQDVIMPARTYGWEVDIAESDQIVRVLVPATCGNLSIIREFHPSVASHRAALAPTRVAASAERAPAPPASASASASASSASPAPALSPAPRPPQSPATAASPAPAASPVPASGPGTTPQTPSAHHSRWPWMIPIALLFLFHGGSGGGGAPPPAGNCGCGCPH